MRALLLIMTLITLVILISTSQVGLPVLLPELNSLSSHLLAGSQTIITPKPGASTEGVSAFQMWAWETMQCKCIRVACQGPPSSGLGRVEKK